MGVLFNDTADVSEIKAMNHMLSAILNSCPSSICGIKPVKDAGNSITDFEFLVSNATHTRLMGKADGEVIGRKLSEFPAHVGEIGRYAGVFTGNKEKEHYEKFDEVTEKWFDVQVVKLADGLVVISSDITDNKRAADLVAQSYEELKATSKKLKNTNLRLEQSNADLLQFAAVASHDLKEPLRKIQTFGNLLVSRAKSKLEPGEQNYLAKIVSASGRMQRLIEDVLTLSKLSAGGQEFETVDLNKVLQMIRDDLEFTVKESGATISVDSLPAVQGNCGQMHQVFQNLISNALKFTDGRRPEIAINYKRIAGSEARKLKLRPVNYHCISVKDNGIGFEKAYKEKIFGIFQRLNGSEYDGTGIGLAICKKIIENHNGYITADSEPDKGSQFNILLPEKQAAAGRQDQ